VRADAVETAASGPSGAAPGSPAIPAGGVRRGGAAGGGNGEPGDATHHRATVDRYRTQLLGTRVRAVFRYPSEARDLELAGRVLLNVSIGRDGRLLEVRLAGRCPHAILCADGLRTIRAAAPFPPIPAELGPSITVEVPLIYAFALE
jgi:protein TonB